MKSNEIVWGQDGSLGAIVPRAPSCYITDLYYLWLWWSTRSKWQRACSHR